MLLSLLATLALTGCSGDDGGTDGPTTDTSHTGEGPTSETADTSATSDTGSVTPPTLDAPSVAVSGAVPTVHAVRFTTPSESTGWVELTGPEGTWTTPPGPAGTSHDIVVLGMKAGATYSVVAVAETSGGSTLRSEPIEVAVAAAPANLAAFTVRTAATSGATQERFWVMTYLIAYDHSYAVIVDQDGDPVWWFAHPDDTQNVAAIKPSRDGRSMLIATFTGPFAGLVRAPLGAMDPSEYRATALGPGHHDFVETPDGRIAYLGHTMERWPWATYGMVDVQSFNVFEIDEGATTSSEAEVVFDAYTGLGEIPTAPCSHTLPVPAPTGGFAATWAHANSITYDAADDTYVLNLRNEDALWKVSRTGELLWRLGGDDGDFAVDVPFDHGHFSQWWGTGFSILSNELHDTTSKVMVYEVDQGGRTATASFEYYEPSGARVAVLGDSQALPGGNVVVTWGGVGHIDEVDPAGTVVWSLAVGSNANAARVAYLSDLYDVSDGLAETAP